MSKKREWSENIDDAIKGANRNLGKVKRNTEMSPVPEGMHVTSNGNLMYYDVSYPLNQKDATKVTTTTVYHRPNLHEEKIKEIERQQLMEDFKYNVAKNLAGVEKKLNRGLDQQNEEIIRVSRRIDQLNHASASQRADDPRIDKIEKKLIDMDKYHHDALDDLSLENGKLRAQIDSLTKTVNSLLADRDSDALNEGIHEEITNLYAKKREQNARIDQALERISDLETQVFENNRKVIEPDNTGLRNDIYEKIEDLKLRQDQDLAQTNNRLMKRIDDLQIAVNENDQLLDDIERRRVEGENNILKKSMMMLRDTSVEGDVVEVKRRVNDLESEVMRPKSKTKVDLEKEPIIKELVQGMAEFENDIKQMKASLAEHENDLQDTAKLIHVLDQQRIEDKEILNNLDRKISTLEKLKDIIQKDRNNFNQQLENLRLATENEFNEVKKSEIQDFRRVNDKVNELVDLQGRLYSYDLNIYYKNCSCLN